MKRVKSKSRKANVKKTDFSSFLLTIVFSALLIMVFTFHLFLSKQIDSLTVEQNQIKEDSRQLDIDIDFKKNKFKEKFQDNKNQIADIFYGSSEAWIEYLPTGNRID